MICDVNKTVELSIIRSIQKNVSDGLNNVINLNNNELMDILINIEVLSIELNSRVANLYKELDEQK